jgi:Protein of unknown function (DUF1573)
MRTVVLAALGLLTIAPPLRAQDQPTGWAGKLFAVDGKIPAGHDFKSVPKGAMLQHRFPISNPYAVPLQITTSVSCGCVTATPTPQVLQPRESGTLDITMDTTRFNGQKTVNVHVTVAHPQFWSTHTLTVQAVCRGDVELNPAQAVFGLVPVGQPVTREVVVRYRGNQPGWQITGVVADPSAPFEVRHQEQGRRGSQVDYRVFLILKGDAVAKSYKGDLTLTTNDPNNPAVAVPYDALVQAPLTASPDVARFAPVRVGAEAEKRIILRAAQPFRIITVDGQGDGVTATPARTDASPAHVLTVKVQPAQPGAVQKTLTVKTDLAGGATVAVRVEATAQP